MCNGKSDNRGNIPHKNIGKKRPTSEKTWNHICNTLDSNIDLPFVNECIKQFIAKNEIDDNFLIVEETKNRNQNEFTNESF